MTLAEVKNFKQASDNCFVTQPTLSMQIKKLEEELGVQLFERDKRSVNITPKYATSKVLVMFNVHIVGNDSGTGIRLLRGSTALGLGDTAGSRARMTAIGYYSNNTSPSAYSGGNTSMTFLDSPATTSATTYKLQAQCLSTQGIAVNKTRYDTDNGNASRGSSTITVMEISV